MENGQDGNREEHDESVVSRSDNPHDAHDEKDTDPMRLPWPPSTDATATNAHKRTVSGGFLSRFSFLRPAEPASDAWLQQGDAPRSKTSIDDEEGPRLPSEELGRQLTIKQRKRKGSLRKSALLGVKRLGSDGREKRNSLLQREFNQGSQHAAEGEVGVHSTEEGLQIKGLGLSKDGVHSAMATDIPPTSTAVTEARLSMLIALQGNMSNQDDSSSKAEYSSASTDPKLQPGYTSTTEDDDDVLSFARPTKPTAPTSALLPPSDPAATSYFTAQPMRMRTRSVRRLRPSPLQHASAPAPEPYSYTETEYWGWVILFVTWLLFTVGMGSCLDIWSWAWDVGETPYAPPELEDDPTLPIVGYYPALIVLTGVVAWVWITVAWVGMKYFRHAKIEDIR